MKRIVRYGQDEARLFEMAYEAASVLRPGQGRGERRLRLERLLETLEMGTIEKEREPGQNPDLELRTLDGPATYELTEAERDLLLEALDAIDWPGFASAKYGRARALLMDSERVESPVLTAKG